MLERFIAKLDPAADNFPTEQYAAEIAVLLAEWSAALRRNASDVEEIGARLAPQPGWRVSRWKVHPEVRSELKGKAFTDITGAVLDVRACSS